MSEGLSKFHTFDGRISAAGHSCAMSFRARIDCGGEIEFDLEPLPLTNETKFILSARGDTPSELAYFELMGVAKDGTKFETFDLHFIKTGINSNARDIPTLTLVAQCLTGKFTRKPTEPVDTPVLRVLLKGFRNFGELRANSVQHHYNGGHERPPRI